MYTPILFKLKSYNLMQPFLSPTNIVLSSFVKVIVLIASSYFKFVCNILFFIVFYFFFLQNFSYNIYFNVFALGFFLK